MEISKVRELVAAAGIEAAVEVTENGVALAGIDIEVVSTSTTLWSGKVVTSPTYLVSRAVSVGGGYWDPPDVDIHEVGTYPTLARAVAAALAEIVSERIAAHEERLADDEYARECAGG